MTGYMSTPAGPNADYRRYSQNARNIRGAVIGLPLLPEAWAINMTKVPS